MIWYWLAQRYDPLLTIGAIIAVLGVVLLWRSNGQGLLQAIGGGVLGAGLTVIVSAITSTRASLEAYRRDANITRKRDIYGPLHAELKPLRERLERAQRHGDPYPIHVLLIGSGAGPAGNDPDANRFALVLWTYFKSNYQIDNFNETGRTLLDAVHRHVGSYNSVIEPAHLLTKEVLTAHTERAIVQEKETKRYQAWLEEYRERKRTNAPTPYPPGEDEWYERLETTPPPGKTLGAAWVDSWLSISQYIGATRALGWLLASRPDKAAQAIHGIYSSGGTPPPRMEWLEDIVRHTMSDVSTNDEYKAVHTALGGLLTATREAEQHLERAMTKIRDRYEGGTPWA